MALTGAYQLDGHCTKGGTQRSVSARRRELRRREAAALIITAFLRDYISHVQACKEERMRHLHTSTAEVQRVWRGYQGRKTAEQRRCGTHSCACTYAQQAHADIHYRNRLDTLSAMSGHVIRVQARYRGYRARGLHPEVSQVIALLRAARQREAEAAIVVCVQTSARAFLARRRRSAAAKLVCRSVHTTADRVVCRHRVGEKTSATQRLQSRATCGCSFHGCFTLG
jgi:hypothetical protein